MRLRIGRTKPMLVDLTWHEYEMAGHVGFRRKVESLRLGHKDRYGSVWTPRNDVGTSVISSVAELAVGKCLNIYWDGAINTFSRPDLGNLEIKSQDHHTIDNYKEANFLVIKPDSPPELIHILVLTHSHLRYEVVGWVFAKEGKLKQFERQNHNRPMFYGVPVKHLNNIKELP